MSNKDELANENSEIRQASKRGAVEDIIHISNDDDGHDLRVFNHFGSNLKQNSNIE